MQTSPIQNQLEKNTKTAAELEGRYEDSLTRQSLGESVAVVSFVGLAATAVSTLFNGKASPNSVAAAAIAAGGAIGGAAYSAHQAKKARKLGLRSAALSARNILLGLELERAR